MTSYTKRVSSACHTQPYLLLKPLSLELCLPPSYLEITHESVVAPEPYETEKDRNDVEVRRE